MHILYRHRISTTVCQTSVRVRIAFKRDVLDRTLCLETGSDSLWNHRKPPININVFIKYKTNDTPFLQQFTTISDIINYNIEKRRMSHHYVGWPSTKILSVYCRNYRLLFLGRNYYLLYKYYTLIDWYVGNSKFIVPQNTNYCSRQ